jgi:23S rRNA (cytosine1962-C5)-methyltransferase
MDQSKTLITSAEKDYELLDSGDGQKLERFGKFVLSRPDPQALWSKNLSPAEWDKADGVFNRGEDKSEAGSKGRWKLKAGTSEKWQINFAGLKFFIEPTPFKHVGLFPEQRGNWEWVKQILESQKSKVEILNLFGYTGGASLACAEAGAAVVHVDGSKVALTRAKENAELSGLADKPIRWILDDAREFVKRELRRGNKYDGIIMDPPSFGRGDKGQVWKIEEDFVPIFNDCLKLFSDKPIFFLINGYAAGYSSIAYANNLEILKKKFGGTIEAGELTIQEGKTPPLREGNLSRRVSEEGDEKVYRSEKAAVHRFLPCGIFARWSAK